MTWKHYCPMYTTSRTFPKMVSTAPFLPPGKDGCTAKCFRFVNLTHNVTVNASPVNLTMVNMTNITPFMTTPPPEGYTGPTAYIFRSENGDVLMQEPTYCDGAVA